MQRNHMSIMHINVASNAGVEIACHVVTTALSCLGSTEA